MIGDEQLALVADALGRNVLVSLRLLDDGRGVNAGLGGERALAHIRGVTIRRPVEELVEPMRDACDAAKRIVADVDLEFFGIFRLELQRRDNRDEIGVSAALAQAVECPLNLARAGTDRGETVSDRLLGIVMGVNADPISRYHLADLADDALDFVRQRPAIGVAQHHPVGAFVVSGFGTSERIAGICLVAVEKVLAVEQDFAAFRFCRAHAIAN